jgi:small Trp-rich protein
MWMLVIGLLLLAAKVADIGPTAAWSWWAVAAPFIAAAVWWQFADATGLTRRRAMQKMDERKEQRRDRALEALGLGTRQTGKVKRAPGESRTGRDSLPSRREPRR